MPYSCNVVVPLIKNIDFRSFNNLTSVRRSIGSPPTEVEGNKNIPELWNNANVDLNFVKMLHC